MKKTLIALSAILLVLVATMYIGGSLMPREHLASSTIAIPAPLDSVWAAVRDFAAQPAWWDDLERVERLEDPDGREAWTMHMSSGALGLAVERSDAPTMLVTRILADANAAFGGIWTYQLAAEGDGTRVTVVEAGYINNKFFRFIAGTVMGMHGTMDSYLADLGRHFGSDATLEHVD